MLCLTADIITAPKFRAIHYVRMKCCTYTPAPQETQNMMSEYGIMSEQGQQSSTQKNAVK